MKEVYCITQCFHDGRLWEVGDVMVIEEGDTREVPPHFSDNMSEIDAQDRKEDEFARKFDSASIRRRNTQQIEREAINGRGSEEGDQPITMSQLAKARHPGATTDVAQPDKKHEKK